MGNFALPILGKFELPLTDVTEEVLLRQELEAEKKALTRALARSQIAVDIAGLGIFERDVGATEMRWDERFYDILSVDPAAVTPSPKVLCGFIHPEDREAAIKNLDTVITSGEPVHTSFRIVSPSGDVRYLRTSCIYVLDANGNPETALGVAWDVTEQVHLLDRLTRQRELHAATLRSIGDAVVRTDTAGRIQYV